jgi:hypothetical protein
LKTLKNGWPLARPRQCALLLDSFQVSGGVSKL